MLGLSIVQMPHLVGRMAKVALTSVVLQTTARDHFAYVY